MRGCVGPERSIFPRTGEYFLPREYFTLGGCAGPERTELRERLTKGSTELATVYLGGCMLLEIDLGGSDVWLELKAQQATCPCTVRRDLSALKAN